jgi:16S rRNA pseudouridine516 synthase
VWDHVPRLDQLLARNLALSRRDALRLLRRGFVQTASGEPMRDGKLKIDDAQIPLRVRVDEDEVVLRTQFHLLQHKPVGVVTARRDERHPTAYGLLRDQPLFPELRAVGRLDLDASGLLLWTTEGAHIHALTHPKRAVPRTYQVALARPWSAPPSEGILLDDYRPRVRSLDGISREELHPALVVPEGAIEFASITLESGRFHEVKRIFSALGSEVVGLARTAHGAHELPPDLAPGECMEVEL